MISRRILIPFLLFIPLFLHGQSIVDIINTTEKAVFEARAYGSNKLLAGKASGFFISADGLAITMGYIFEHADSAVVSIRSGKTFKVDKVVSFHPYTNIALIKVEQSRQKSFDFLLPAKQSYKQGEELLFFTHEQESEDGMTLAPVNDVVHFPYLSRTGIIEGSYGRYSAGAPAINSNGQLCGIVNVSKNGQHKILYNTYLLNDSNWVNIPLSDAKDKKVNPGELSDLFSLSFLNVICDQHIEAAKSLSRYIRKHPESELAYCIRAYARYNYQNLVGCREDLKSCEEINPNGFLQYYFKGLFKLKENKIDEAGINFDLCLDRKPDFAPAISELAILNFAKYKDIKAAYRWHSEAINSDSLLAQSYYERSKLRMQHSSDQDATLDDINKTIYLDPDLSGSYSIRGTIYFSRKDYLLAIRDFDQAIEKDINDVHAWFNRGVSHYNIGLHEKACYDWDKAGKLGNFEAYKYISRYCKNVKRNVYGR
ncbi:MAG: trypsin-like peptidase domain-containing protein [Carboxylicivirga sp.]|jgi:tetratricopeptide (TPR) repeat protein|nr:trypsin-like peptidase domain-containing protein [Carboxylicivirga sp.]